MFKQIYKGFLIPFQSIKFLFAHKKLFTWVGLPIVLNFFIYSIIFYLAIIGIKGLRGVFPGDIWYWSILYYVILSVGLVILIFFAIFTFVALINVIGAPFYEMLSQRTSKILEIKAPGSQRTKIEEIKVYARALFDSIKRILMFLAAQIALILISLLPLIGPTFITLANILITGWFFAMEFLDYELDRQEWTFEKKLQAWKKHKWSMLGFGLGALLGSLIPIFNLIFLPCCVIGGSLYFKKFLQK